MIPDMHASKFVFFVALYAGAWAESTVTIIHLTDVHVDPFYVTGSIASSGCFCETHETCPRFPESCTIASSPADAAGPYGDAENNCATPPALWSSAMTFLGAGPATSSASIVFFTGDFGEAGLSAPCAPPPAATARQQILDAVARGMSSVRATFPAALVFGVFGNHDTAPGDAFSSSSEMAWLYGAVGAADGAFGRSLAGDAPALATLQATGWYATNLTEQTGLIALNTNYWNTFNTGNSSAAAELGEAQFLWLSTALASLAASNRSALVIGHIPPSIGAWQPGYYARYRALLTRFPVVLAQFFGHDHRDLFTIVRACAPPPPAPPGPYEGPWVETTGIEWCSGGNLPVGDVWGRGTEPGAPHCPYVPAANGSAAGRIALCEGVCGNASACRGFTWYPDDGSTYGACCFRTSCVDKPPAPASTAACFEKVLPSDCGGVNGSAQEEPLHVLYAAPSLTEGYPASNPGLRAYTADAASLAPLDALTFVMNLSAANAAWAPAWKLEYAATALYGMPDVSAGSWADAVDRMARNGSTEWTAFMRASVKQYDGPSAPGPCEGACKDELVGWLNGSAVDGY